jgi:hypothetical protein
MTIETIVIMNKENSNQYDACAATIQTLRELIDGATSGVAFDATAAAPLKATRC